MIRAILTQNSAFSTPVEKERKCLIIQPKGKKEQQSIMSDEETESITVLSARLKATKAAKASKTKQQAQEGGVESKGNQKVSPQRKSAGTKFSFGGYLLDELNDLETELVEVERWRPKQTTGFLASLGPNGLLKKVKELDPLLQNVLNPKLATQKGSITDLLRDAIVQTDITVEELDLILSCDETFFGLKARGQRVSELHVSGRLMLNSFAHLDFVSETNNLKDYIKNAKMVNLLRRMATEMELEMKLDGRSSFSACYPFLVELGIQSIPSGRNTVQKIE
jgi:hypothetical protein